MSNWVTATVIKNTHWNNSLFSLKIHADIAPFEAGQFIKLGLEMEGQLISRAYSFVNAPSNNKLEIYAIKVDEGQLSPKLHDLKEGDTLLITSQASGFFTLKEVPDAEHIWLFASGTAIGPYLSMLQSPEIWQRFKKIILVHAVRHASDLNYQGMINQLKERHTDQLIVQPFVSQEPAIDALSGRIPQSIQDGLLERCTGFTLSPEHSQVMICGNPDMVKDTHSALEKKGLKKHLRRQPGHITMERYW